MSDPAWTNLPIKTAASDALRKNTGDCKWEATSSKTADPNKCNLTMADLIGVNSSGQEKENVESKFSSLREPDRVCVVLNGHGKLGSVYTQVARILARQGGWKRKKTTTGRFHMVFGEAGGVGIPFKRFSQVFRYDYGIKPLVNYNRNCKSITDKAMLTQTLVKYFGGNKFSDENKFLPETFLFWPGRDEVSQHLLFQTSFKRNIGGNIWIVKPCNESHGKGIFLSSDYDEIIDHINSQPDGSKPWLVQRYVENPVLLRGGRKFDMRIWVLLTHDFKVYIHREGVIRTSSVTYDTSDLRNKFIHMTNHSIQEEHEDFGKHEEGNEIFFENFHRSNIFEEDISLEEDILPQVKDIVRETFLAAKPVLEKIEEIDDYHSFMFFGFDFIVDSNSKVWLIEVNASPAVAKPLLPKVAADIIKTAIDPIFPRPNCSDSQESDFELVFESKGNCGYVANMPAPETLEDVEIESFGQQESVTRKK